MLIYVLFPIILQIICLTKGISNDQSVRQSENYCVTPKKEVGYCIPIVHCSSLRALLIDHGQEPPITELLRESACGNDHKNRPKVCCPNDQETPTRILTSSHVNHKCGKTNSHTSRVTAGQNSSAGNWPWIAALGYQQDRSTFKDYKCGGSLISDQWILTAGHCVSFLDFNLKLTHVRLGDVHLNDQVDDGAHPVELSVDKVIPHPNYTQRPLVNDIALLYLHHPVTFTDHIHPICMLKGDKFLDDSFYFGKEPYIAGWGAIIQGGGHVQMLQEAQVSIIESKKCRGDYGEIHSAVIDEKVLCAGSKGKDSCQGDSGGPLMIAYNRSFYLAGIVSFGYGCGHENYPGVYTRVARFADWVSQITGL